MEPLRRRQHYLPFVVAVGAGALLIGAPARSQAPTTVSIVASDFQWTASGGGPANVTIAPGGTVDFSYPSGKSTHNAVFTGMQPSACTQTAGTASNGAVPPLPNPNSAGSAGWAGSCTFTAAGTYRFVCGLHDFMTGSVTVAAAGATPTASPTASPQPTPTPAASPGPAASALRVSTHQRGAAIRGSARVTRAGSTLLVRAFATRRALSRGRSLTRVLVGRQLRTSVGDARVAFSVPLSPVARRALRRNGRLSISLRVAVTPTTGTSFTATRAVILRPA